MHEDFQSPERLITTETGRARTPTTTHEPEGAYIAHALTQNASMWIRTYAHVTKKEERKDAHRKKPEQEASTWTYCRSRVRDNEDGEGGKEGYECEVG
eukprot:2068774-Pleurochrysis_carterae.AAC.1